MKKKYFIISSIILIVLSLLMMLASGFIAKVLVNSLNESMKVFEEIEAQLMEKSNIDSQDIEIDDKKEPNIFDKILITSDSERINNLLDMSNEDFWTDYYQRYIIVTSIVFIVISAITIVIAKNNHILRNKKRIIIYSIIIMLLGTNVFISLIGLVNLIIVLCLKRKDEEDYPIPNGKITPLERLYNSKKEIVLGVVAILAYVLLYVVLRKCLASLFPTAFENETLSIIVDLIIDIVVLGIILLIYHEELLNGIKAFKADFAHYRRFVRRTFILTLVVTMIANVVRLVITSHTASENQFSLLDLPMWYLAFAAVIWAPIVEECVFRGSLRRIIPNKYLFIIISGLIFGVLHAISESTLFDVVITSIPYCIMGWAFALVYAKSNNIIVNICLHALNNFLAVVLMFTVLGC